MVLLFYLSSRFIVPGSVSPTLNSGFHTYLAGIHRKAKKEQKSQWSSLCYKDEQVESIVKARNESIRWLLQVGLKGSCGLAEWSATWKLLEFDSIKIDGPPFSLNVIKLEHSVYVLLSVTILSSPCKRQSVLLVGSGNLGECTESALVSEYKNCCL